MTGANLPCHRQPLARVCGQAWARIFILTNAFLTAAVLRGEKLVGWTKKHGHLEWPNEVVLAMRRFNLRVSSALERCRHIYFLCAFYGRVDLFCAAATPLISCCRSNRASSSTEDFSEGITICHLPRFSFFISISIFNFVFKDFFSDVNFMMSTRYLHFHVRFYVSGMRKAKRLTTDWETAAVLPALIPFVTRVISWNTF